MPLNPLAKHFHFGEKQNASHYRTYCKFCVDHQELEIRKASSWDLEYAENDAAAHLTIEEKIRTRCRIYMNAINTVVGWRRHPDRTVEKWQDQGTEGPQ